MSATKLASTIATLLLLTPLVALADPQTAASTAGGEDASFGWFGVVHLYRPEASPHNVVLFVSGDGGWNLGVVDMARALSGLDALVVGIDVTHYLRQISLSKDACTYAAADFEALSQFIQKKLGLPSYLPPVLVGYSSGATLVYATLVQAPAGTFRGAMSLGFCPDLQLTKPLCRGEGLESGAVTGGHGYRFLPAAGLEVPWVALQGLEDQVCDPATTEDFARRIRGAQVISLPGVGHGFSVQKNWMPQFEEAFRRIVARPEPSGPTPTAVQGLPLVEVPARGEGNALAVIVSGDGGWASLDRQVGEALAKDGVAVVGLDSLQYLWTRRTPEELGEALTRILRHYLTAWGRDDVLLIGYSLGADLLPFMASRLPDELRKRVRLVALLGPSPGVEFEFHVSEWFSSSASPDAVPVAPEVAKLGGIPVLCFWGKQEQDSLCPTLKSPGVTSIQLPGGHHFGGNYAQIARRILEAAP